MKYTVIEWVVDWAYDYHFQKPRQNMTDYEKKLHDSIYSKELPF